jgi:serine/threonine-protein kinase
MSGRYVLLERIGIGGMAEVFRASAHGAEGFERPIAIKRILPSLSEDHDFVKMFVDEAKIAVQLQHPNIVQIFDLGREGGEYFIAMEYVQGKDLRAIQDRVAQLRARMPLAVAIHLGLKICEALHHAHFASGSMGQPLNVVHRDVTPQNVLVSFDGEVKVTDFGLAKAAGRATQTQSGVIKGKLAYMAPEAFAGLRVDHRSDVFGVGILLWEMITGRRLFLGKNDVDTVTKAQAAIVPSLRSIDPSIPEEVDRIVLRALTREREERYQTAEELHDELEAYAYGDGQFLSTSALAGWLRNTFPPEAAPKAGPKIETREIRLADLAQERTSESEPPEEIGLEDELQEEVSEPATMIAADEVSEPATMIADDADMDDDAAGSTMLERAPDLSEVEVRDTMPPPDGVTGELAEEGEDDDAADRTIAGDPFEDTTGKLSPQQPEFPTEQRYDRDLMQTTIPRSPPVPKGVQPLPVPQARPPAGTVPLGPPAPLAWDEEEESTEIVSGPRRPPR